MATPEPREEMLMREEVSSANSRHGGICLESQHTAWEDGWEGAEVGEVYKLRSLRPACNIVKFHLNRKQKANSQALESRLGG